MMLVIHQKNTHWYRLALFYRESGQELEWSLSLIALVSSYPVLCHQLIHQIQMSQQVEERSSWLLGAVQ